MSSTCFETEGSSSGRRMYRVTQKTGTFKKTQQKLKKTKKKNY